MKTDFEKSPRRGFHFSNSVSLSRRIGCPITAYSKRAMALDQVEVMRQRGFDKFGVIGHSRSGRVRHRMALDHPDRVIRLAVLDIVPAYYLYSYVTLEFVQSYFHWFN